MPQDREGARTDPNHVLHPPHTRKPPRLYPPAGPVIENTQEALFDLADTLLQHGTDVQGNVGQGVGTSKADPSHSKDPSTDHTGDAEHSKHCVTPHAFTSCGGICYGPASYFQDNGLLRFISKNHYFHIIFFLYHNLVLFNYLTIYVNKYIAGVP